jgi:four helix bundle protein
LAFEIYRITNKFPKNELYGLTSQLRRAVLSVPPNIAEGYSRRGDKELSRFINIAIGSLAEVEYLLRFSRRLGYINEQEYLEIEVLRDEVGKMIWGFYKKIKN